MGALRRAERRDPVLKTIGRREEITPCGCPSQEAKRRDGTEDTARSEGVPLVGDASTKEIQISLYNERWIQGLLHCGCWHADRCTDVLLPVEMRWFIPTNSGQGGPGPEWGRWFSSAGQEGEEPPAEIQTLYDHYNTMNTVLDDAERVAAGQKIFDWLAENPLAVGSLSESPGRRPDGILPPSTMNAENCANHSAQSQILPVAGRPVGWERHLHLPPRSLLLCKLRRVGMKSEE